MQCARTEFSLLALSLPECERFVFYCYTTLPPSLPFSLSLAPPPPSSSGLNRRGLILPPEKCLFFPSLPPSFLPSPQSFSSILLTASLVLAHSVIELESYERERRHPPKLWSLKVLALLYREGCRSYFVGFIRVKLSSGQECVVGRSPTKPREGRRPESATSFHQN